MEEPTGDKFTPNQEYLQSLMSMGISEAEANEALFCTGNESIEAAINYCFPVHDDFSYEAGDQSDEDSGKRYKMTFVVNTSLKMGVGKIAAQVGHACLGLYREMRTKGDREEALNEWDYYGEKKIVLKGNTTDHLQELFARAKELNVPCYLVADAGHTQIAAGSITVLSVFGDEEEVNAVTGTLSLL